MIQNYSFNRFEVAVFQKSKYSDRVCGDSYFVKETDQYFIGAVVDGLGSGEKAREASHLAVGIIEEHSDLSVETLMYMINDALVNVRGAVVSIFKIDYQHQNFTYSSVGNVQFTLIPPNDKPINPLPNYGFLSGRPIKIKTQVFPYPKNSAFIIHSDGLKSHSDLRKLCSEKVSSHYLVNFISRMIDQQEGDDLTLLVGKSVEV